VDSVYKKIEVVGTSTTSVTDAINTAVVKATSTVKNVGWFEVIESRGRIQDGAVTQFQVTLKIGFKLED
jgi:flavin-binding protein dodecin